MTSNTVKEHFDVFKEARPSLFHICIGIHALVHKCFLQCRQKLSVTALSQQFPWRLILQSIPSRLSAFRNDALQYCLPQSE